MIATKIEEVRNAEKSAEEIIYKAWESYEQVMYEATKNGRELLEKAKEEALHKADELLLKARDDAKLEIEDLRREHEKRLNEIVKITESCILKAKDEVVKGIIELAEKL